MKVKKFGVVGCGMISRFHARAIREIGAELVACYDRLPIGAERYAEEFGCKAYHDFQDFLKDPDIEVVTICTPSGAHLDPAVAAAKAGKHVIVEKPLEVTVERCDEIIDACEKAGVTLSTIFPSRFHQSSLLLKQAIESGRFGKLTLGDAIVKWYRTQQDYDSGVWRGTWKLDGGGALMNQGVHGVDMITWLMGGVKSVRADCKRLLWNTEVEDTAVITLTYKNGAVGVIECTTSVYPGLETVFTVGGQNGSVLFGDNMIYSWKFKNDTPSQPEIEDAFAGTNCSYDDCSPHAVQIEDMARAVIENREPMITGKEAMQSVKVILAIYESARTGREVFL